jgi:hypothetical protein
MVGGDSLLVVAAIVLGGRTRPEPPALSYRPAPCYTRVGSFPASIPRSPRVTSRGS